MERLQTNRLVITTSEKAIRRDDFINDNWQKDPEVLHLEEVARELHVRI